MSQFTGTGFSGSGSSANPVFPRATAHTAGVVIYAGALGLTCWIHASSNDGPSPVLENAPLAAYGAALGFGLADSTFNTQCYALLGQIFSGERSVSAFTAFNLYNNLGSYGGGKRPGGRPDSWCCLWSTWSGWVTRGLVCGARGLLWVTRGLAHVVWSG